MKKYHLIGGEPLPVLFSHETIYDYEIQTGRPFTADFIEVTMAMSTDTATIPIVKLCEIARCGLVAGGIAEKKAFLKTARELFSMTRTTEGMTVLGEIIVQCGESMPRAKEGAQEEQQGEGEAPASSSTGKN